MRPPGKHRSGRTTSFGLSAGNGDGATFPRPRPGLFQEHHDAGRWAAWVRSDVGLVRPRLEDSWRVLCGVPMAGVAWDAFAVFDGLGGRPGGQQAAWTAAQGLDEAMAEAGGPSAVLRALDARVRKTGGATTAAMALAPCTAPDDLWLVGVGDSCAYALVDGEARPLLARDRASRHVVTECLGVSFRRGHSVRWRLQPGNSVLLCTDGVDDVVGSAALRDCLAAPIDEAEAALDQLFAEIRVHGAPDNATVVLMNRR